MLLVQSELLSDERLEGFLNPESVRGAILRVVFDFVQVYADRDPPVGVRAGCSGCQCPSEVEKAVMTIRVILSPRLGIAKETRAGDLEQPDFTCFVQFLDLLVC